MSITYPPETNNGVITSWIPLTTGWTDTTACNARYILYNARTTEYTTFIIDKSAIESSSDVTLATFVAYDPSWGIWVDPAVQCMPSEAISSRYPFPFYHDRDWHWRQQGNPETKISLLPLICPDPWSTVATFVKSVISTQVMCCPR